MSSTTCRMKAMGIVVRHAQDQPPGAGPRCCRIHCPPRSGLAGGHHLHQVAGGLRWCIDVYSANGLAPVQLEAGRSVSRRWRMREGLRTSSTRTRVHGQGLGIGAGGLRIRVSMDGKGRCLALSASGARSTISGSMPARGAALIGAYIVATIRPTRFISKAARYDG